MIKLDRRLISGLFCWLCVVAASVTNAEDPMNPNASLNPNETVTSENNFDLSAEEIVKRAEEEEATAPQIAAAAPPAPDYDQPVASLEEPLLNTAKSVTSTKPAVEEKGFYFTADFYGSHSSLMQYKGYQDDLSASLYLQYLPYKLVPFLRFLTSEYYYKPPTAMDSISDRRIAVGGGLDYRFTDWLRFRAMTEQINDRASSINRQQESYGLIYNQYLQLGWLEMNNYAEAFMIPKLASNKLDTFASITLFHTFYLHAEVNVSHSLFPFLSYRLKVNDEAIFGLSGQNASAGGGYKYFRTSGKDNNFAIVVTGHSLVYQSQDFDGDPIQVQAAIQWQTH